MGKLRSHLKKIDYDDWKYRHNSVKLVKPYMFILCWCWSYVHNLAILEYGGCHDNTVIEMVPEMYYYIQKCITMYYLTVSMATEKQPEAMKCAAYVNSSSQCTLK